MCYKELARPVRHQPICHVVSYLLALSMGIKKFTHVVCIEKREKYIEKWKWQLFENKI
jgi:hypothetical protein